MSGREPDSELSLQPLTAKRYRQLLAEMAAADRPLADQPGLAAIRCGASAFAVAMGDGRTIAAGGLVKIWPGRAAMWWLVGIAAGDAAIAKTKEALQSLIAERSGDADFRRIETYLPTSAQWAAAWAAGFGLISEARMRCWGTGGEDFDICATVARQ